MAETDIDSLETYDMVGLGCPVFYYKEPFNVRDFIQSLPPLSGKKWFVFCTHGNIIGNIFPSMTEKLNKKGIQVIGYHNTYAGITVPFCPQNKADFEFAISRHGNHRHGRMAGIWPKSCGRVIAFV